MHVKKGDAVVVLTGKDKGKKGTIVKSFPKKGKVIVEGLNQVKKHVKPRQRDAERTDYYSQFADECIKCCTKR
jgi:large subunit ribosomal protein L24